MTDKQIIEEDMVNAENFCPHYPCQVDCYEARICPFFVETLQQLKVKEQECEMLKYGLGLANSYVNKYFQALQEIKGIAEETSKFYPTKTLSQILQKCEDVEEWNKH